MTDVTLTGHDLEIISAKGLTPERVIEQIQRFQQGYSFVTLKRSCTIGDGITRIPEGGHDHLSGIFNDAASQGKAMKFAPASGAGSRMFQRLMAVGNRHGILNRNNLEAEGRQGDEDALAVLTFIDNLKRFAFFGDLMRVMGEGRLITSLTTGQYTPVLEALLTEKGLNYSNLPKGLLGFHRYNDYCRTAIEEHLVEAIAYTEDRNNIARIHFTVPPTHLQAIQDHIEAVRERYETAGVVLEITYSVQKSSTDTIAVDMNNEPFRDNDDALVFRPGGHGALLENLNELDADLVFLKNIDNVVPDHLKDGICRYKRVLGGYLLEIRQQIFLCLEQLSCKSTDRQALDRMEAFARQRLCIELPDSIKQRSLEERQEYLYNRFNRPLRVCGMVKNTGEPGGGPFWVEHDNGTLSLQIVETAQINQNSSAQREILASSTHFNPVDLVCGIRDFRGNPFNLMNYRDPDTGFISTKSKGGRALKAMEWPGLWNGGMADWNTVFVEVPALTFNPVKTIDDLIRPTHQPGLLTDHILKQE